MPNTYPLHAVVAAVTARIQARSRDTRGAYLQRLRAAGSGGARRGTLSCTNLAHAAAAMSFDDKRRLIAIEPAATPNLAIVSAYNDMLSAHVPLQDFPAWIKQATLQTGATAQFAGGVPAMCDGVTQGQAGMELSLFSRVVIAMATAVALSHQMFDAALYLGVCDKIVPGLLIGALAFGHLPALFVPAGPMTSGLSNDDKAKVRQRYAQGLVGRDELLQAETQAYHGPGTCTFYGTANSNQLLMDIMGLHLPGAAFVPPVASRPTMPLTITRSSTSSPIGSGAGPHAAMATARLAASRVSASRSPVPGGTKAAPGRCSPMMSISS